MVWFKVDDNLAFHPKVLAAGNAAMGLWVRAGSWSAQQLTNGVIPDSILPSLGTVKQAETLAAAGLWRRAAGAWSFHEWNADGRQPTRESVEAERSAARERQRKHREAKASSQRDATVTNSVTNAEVTAGVTPTPTRPDPTTTSNEVVETPLSPDKSDDRDGTLIPDEWRPNQTHIDKANALHLDVKREYQRFRENSERRNRRLKNWNTGFTNWLRKQAEFNQEQQGRPAQQRMAKADENAARFYEIYGGGDDERTGSIQALDSGVSA